MSAQVLFWIRTNLPAYSSFQSLKAASWKCWLRSRWLQRTRTYRLASSSLTTSDRKCWLACAFREITRLMQSAWWKRMSPVTAWASVVSFLQRKVACATAPISCSSTCETETTLRAGTSSTKSANGKTSNQAHPPSKWLWKSLPRTHLASSSALRTSPIWTTIWKARGMPTS